MIFFFLFSLLFHLIFHFFAFSLFPFPYLLPLLPTFTTSRRPLQASGLSQWIGEQLAVLKSIPIAALVMLITAGSAIFTEFTSNTATATILLPILNQLVSASQTFLLLLQILLDVTR